MLQALGAAGADLDGVFGAFEEFFDAVASDLCEFSSNEISVVEAALADVTSDSR